METESEAVSGGGGAGRSEDDSGDGDDDVEVVGGSDTEYDGEGDEEGGGSDVEIVDEIPLPARRRRGRGRHRVVEEVDLSGDNREEGEGLVDGDNEDDEEIVVISPRVNVQIIDDEEDDDNDFLEASDLEEEENAVDGNGPDQGQDGDAPVNIEGDQDGGGQGEGGDQAPPPGPPVFPSSSAPSTATSTVQGTHDDEDSDNQDDEDGPPTKIPKLENGSDEDDASCHICYESYDNSGAHRPCCLKCGHIFGKDCIERWIKAQKRCPDCNSKAMIKDIRIIYVKNLKALDTAELERMKQENDRLKIEKNRVELTNAQLRCQVQASKQEIDRLLLALRTESSSSRPVQETTGNSQNLQEPSTSSKSTRELPSSLASGLRMPRLQIMKTIQIREGQSRVGAYNEWLNLLVVSHSISSALFPGGSFGIKKINSLDMKAFQSFPIHQKPIRDMAFSQLQNDLLLTVSLDRKAVLFNCNSNCTVQAFNYPVPLWSCCWNSVDQHIFYVGSVTGQVTSYDIRAPQEPLNTLFIPATDKSGVSRLKFVPPAYQNQAFNMSGLLIQKLNSVWFCEMLGGSEGGQEPRFHQMPLEGPFLNVDFEPGSRHVLVSGRPRQVGSRFGAIHTVCDLGKTFDQIEDRDIFKCDVVQVMTGGVQESTLLCRSALFSPQQGQVYVAANGEGKKTVRVWDVANVEQKALIRIGHDAALDFVPGSVNDTNFLGIVMDSAFDVYKV